MTVAVAHEPLAGQGWPEVQAKIVYWGPAESGKTTSMLSVFATFEDRLLDDVISVQTTGGRTLWAEFGSLRFDVPRGALPASGTVPVVVHVSATTGQERFLNTREHAAARADGVIFVADCRRARMGLTTRSYDELAAYVPRSVPVVAQANFQDDASAVPAGEVAGLLARVGKHRPVPPVVPTVACKGDGVAKAFVAVLAAILAGP